MLFPRGFLPDELWQGSPDPGLRAPASIRQFVLTSKGRKPRLAPGGSQLTMFRTALSTLLTVALCLAPIASTDASVVKAIAHNVADHNAGYAQVGPNDDGAVPAMEDCASKMKGQPSEDGCPFCSKDKACAPEFCLTKCFQFADVDRTNLVPPFQKAHPRQIQPEVPPSWSEQPQPPPPRA